MTLCVFCSESIPSEQLESHMNEYHSTFLKSHPTSNHSSSSTHNRNTIANNIWQKTPSTKAPSMSSVGPIYDPDILKPLCFFEGRRIKENFKKHKRRDKHNCHKRPHKRRKLTKDGDTQIKPSKRDNKRKNKKRDDVTECEAEYEGEEDAYGGLPYHYHLATHCEPKLDGNHTKRINMKYLLNPIHNTNQILECNVSPTMTPCRLNGIHYKECDHLNLEMNDRDFVLMNDLIQCYDKIIEGKQEDIKDSVMVPNDDDEEVLIALNIADLEEYNFISNPNEPALSPMSIPPLVTVSDSNSPEIIAKPIAKITKKAQSKTNRTSNSSSLEPIVCKSNNRNPTRLSLPTLQTPKQQSNKHKTQTNMNNIPPLNQVMGKQINSANLALINVNNLNNLIQIAQNNNISQNNGNQPNIALMKLNNFINNEKRDKVHTFTPRNNNQFRMQSMNHNHRIRTNGAQIRGNGTQMRPNGAQIISIHNIVNNNANSSPTTSNTTSNSTNSMSSMNVNMSAINIMDGVDNDGDILNVLRKTFHQNNQMNTNYNKNGNNRNGNRNVNNNNLSLLNNFNLKNFMRK